MGRRAENRGWTAMPSFNQLEQLMDQLHLGDGGDPDFMSLPLEEVDRLAGGSFVSWGTAPVTSRRSRC